MTNPRVMVKPDGGGRAVLDEEATRARRNRKVYSEQEVQDMLAAADRLPTEYFRLRAKAVVSFGKSFGKRRSEIASLAVGDLEIKGDVLAVTFTLRKKRKKGLFQYMKLLKHQVLTGRLPASEVEGKTQRQLEQEWRAWQLTKDGVHVKEEKSVKGVNLSSPYAAHIIRYWLYVKENYKGCQWLFPSGRAVFDQYVVITGRHCCGKELLYILKELNPNGWMHLFRDTKGAEIAERKGRTIDGVYAVKDALDLENPETAYHYIRRYATDIVQE